MKKTLRLSQCMIVKNEEKNIRRALSWGKGIVCEQIVVDTGSEDRTVAIAEEMGATVFHYQWEDDFSAAKNFALSKATGDWIAFLDADEYFQGKDLEGLKKLLVYLAAYPVGQQPDAVRCSMLHLDREGKVFSTTMQDRLVRNDKNLRYQNRIHEKLMNISGRRLTVYDVGDTLAIYHTGYASDESQNKNKAERNLSLLLKEVGEHPDKYSFWSYIGDSRLAQGDYAGALEAFRKVIDHPEEEMDYSLRLNAFSSAVRVLGILPQTTEAEIMELYQKYLAVKIPHPDMEYWVGQNLLRFGKQKECAVHLEKALQEMENGDFPFTLYITGELDKVYSTLVLVYAREKEANKAVHYAVLALRVRRYQDDVLNTLVLLFKDNHEKAENVYSFLSKIYDFGSSKDIFFVYKAAKLVQFYKLEDYIYHTLSESEIAFLEKQEVSPYFLTTRQAAERYPSIPCHNSLDFRFVEIMEEIRKEDIISLSLRMNNALREKASKEPAAYDKLLSFYEKNPFWGKLVPEQDEYGAFRQRAEFLKTQQGRIIELYGNLSDYRSRRVLCALLDSWMHLDSLSLEMASESCPQVFDPDLMPDAAGKRFVDLWATEGNDVRSFLQSYGDSYEKILCYVQGEEKALKLTCNLRGVKRLEIITRSKDEVDIDHDIIGAAGFIRLHGEGEELRLLDRCSAQLAAYRPALIISAYYGYESLFSLAERILQINPAYRLHLRYHGAAYVPSDYYLIAI